MRTTQSKRLDWAIPGGLLAAAALILWLAPAERTLGQGIKVVYLHVALSWAGMAGLVLAGLLGLGIAISGSDRLQSLAQTISRVAIGLFGTGFVISMLAAWINWGGIFWDEPRTRASISALGIALLIQFASGWFPWKRVVALAYSLPPAFLVWSTLSAPLVLHPGNPILTSASTPIRLTFFGLFALCCLGAAWLVWTLQRRRTVTQAAGSFHR